MGEILVYHQMISIHLYYIKFWNDDLIETIAEQKNIYSFQKSGKIINRNVTKSEIEQFTGI